MERDGQIRVLPIHVANKIAAGEVVERPASALKELVENAIDAGADRIDISITAGGRKLVSVRDNGCGMNRDNALLSLERQATSKIRPPKGERRGYKACRERRNDRRSVGMRCAARNLR